MHGVALLLLYIFGTIFAENLGLKPFSFDGVKDKYNARAHRLSRFPTKKTKRPKSPFGLSNHAVGVKGHAIINGEYVETERVLVQKPTALGVAYFPYGKPKVPVFIRAVKESNKRYIVFQDPYLPPGEGFLVVLKKIPLKVSSEGQRLIEKGVGASMMPVPQAIPYEAFHLHLGNNIQGTFDRLNARKFAYGIRTKFSSRRKARLKWARRRKMKSRTRQRYGIARWRGKRSVPLPEKRPMKPEDYCYISRLNISVVKRKAEEFSLMFAEDKMNDDIDFDM